MRFCGARSTALPSRCAVFAADMSPSAARHRARRVTGVTRWPMRRDRSVGAASAAPVRSASGLVRAQREGGKDRDPRARERERKRVASMTAKPVHICVGLTFSALPLADAVDAAYACRSPPPTVLEKPSERSTPPASSQSLRHAAALVLAARRARPLALQCLSQRSSTYARQRQVAVSLERRYSCQVAQSMPASGSRAGDCTSTNSCAAYRTARSPEFLRDARQIAACETGRAATALRPSASSACGPSASRWRAWPRTRARPW